MGNKPDEGLDFMSALDNLPEFDTPDKQISQAVKALRALANQETRRRMNDRRRRSDKPDEE
jgi:hypothetical protein